MIRIPTHREPTHPGEMLLEEFLVPMGITQKELSKGIHVPYQRINEIINKLTCYFTLISEYLSDVSFIYNGYSS